MLGAVDDLLAIVRPEGAAVVTHLVGELLHVGAVGIHGVDVEVTIARGSEDNVLAVAGDGGLGVVAARVGKLFQIAAIRLRRIDLIGIVDRPDVAVGVIGLRWTLGACRVSRGEKDAIAGGQEIGASGSDLAGSYVLGRGGVSVGRVHGYRVNLVAWNAFALVLKNQIFVVEGEIGFGTLAAESKLPHVFQMLCLFRNSQRAGGCLRWRGRWSRVSNHPTAEHGGHKDE